MNRLLIVLTFALFFTPSMVHAATTVNIQGTVEAGSAVTVNGVVATVTGTTYTATVPLSLGPNTIVATATDMAGNSASAQVVVHLGTKVNVQGTVDDPSVTTVTVSTPTGSTSASLNAGNFSALVPMVLGVNVVTVDAQDAANNQSSKTSRVFLARPPVVHP